MTTIERSAPSAPGWGLRGFLIAVAAIELIGSLSEFPSLFVPQDPPSPGFEMMRQATTAYVVAHPLIAFGALVPALLGRVRQAIVFLAVLVLAAWATDLPEVFLRGVGWAPTLLGMLPALQMFGYPLIAVVALWLAWRDRHLWIAALLVAVPLAIQLAGIAIFAIGVMLYGF